MQSSLFSQEPYRAELFEQLKKAYDQRCEELGKAFTLAVQRVEESEVLQEMKGDDLAEFRLQHIQEISRQVMTTEQEMHMEQYMRTVSELKAQLAVQRMELQTNARKSPEKEASKRVRELEEEVRSLKRQVEARESQEIGLENMVDREIKNKLRVVEQDYILKVQHERILQQMQASFRAQAKSKKSLQQETKEAITRTLTQKYDQLLELQKKNHQQSLRSQKDKFQNVMKDLSRQNEMLKVQVEALKSQIKILSSKVEDINLNISDTVSRQILDKSNILKDLKLIDDIQELEHFKSRVKRETPFSYQLPSDDEGSEAPFGRSKRPEEVHPQGINKTYSKQSFDTTDKVIERVGDRGGHERYMDRRVDKDISDKPPHRTNNLNLDRGQVLPRSPIPRGNISPRWADPNATKFQDIQHSFAKELADLRSKMAENRERIHSPETRSSKGYVREESVKRRFQQTSNIPSTYSPKYSLKNYHHY